MSELKVPDHLRDDLPSWIDDALSRMEIDKNRLDDEACIQPRLFMMLANVHSEKIRELKEAEQSLEKLRNEIYLRERYRAEREGVKVTEATLNALIVRDPSYQEALSTVYRARQVVDYLNNVLRAAKDRSDMIDALTRLWTSSYFTVK